MATRRLKRPRDRDRAYGTIFIQRLCAMGIRDDPIAPRSPWRNGRVERLIGSIRRECLDHMIVRSEDHRGGRRDNALFVWVIYNLAAWHAHWIEGAR